MKIKKKISPIKIAGALVGCAALAIPFINLSFNHGAFAEGSGSEIGCSWGDAQGEICIINENIYTKSGEKAP